MDRVMVQVGSLENIKYALLRVRLFSSFLSGLQSFRVHHQLDSAQLKEWNTYNIHIAAEI